MARSTRSPAPTRTADGRARILDEAERLFAERGITGVSLREVTDEDVAFMHANTKTYVDRRERYRTLTRVG